MNGLDVHTVVVDADAIIALFVEADTLHAKAQALFESFQDQKTRLVYPATALVETVDTIQRRIKKYEVAAQIAEMIMGSEFATDSVEAVSGEYLKEAVKYFQEGTSNRKTLADAVVAAVAKRLNADGVFSFDEWYQKLGFKLAADLIEPTKLIDEEAISLSQETK